MGVSSNLNFNTPYNAHLNLPEVALLPHLE